MQEDEIVAVDAAFSHILRLRLNHQLADIAAGGDGGHGIRMALLHDLDKAILRESLKQARRLQQRLKLNYSL
jgi:CBS domain-containing protein